jgi:hypothetical protein
MRFLLARSLLPLLGLTSAVAIGGAVARAQAPQVDELEPPPADETGTATQSESPASEPAEAEPAAPAATLTGAAAEIPPVPQSYGGPAPVEEEVPEGPNPLDLSSYMLQIAAVLSGPPDTDFEEVLNTHGYGNSDLVFGAEVDVRFRLISFWWLGGRVALRERSWERFRGAPASAFSVTGLLVTGVRFSANPVLDVGVVGGVGVGPLLLTIEEGTDARFTFHAHGAAEVGFTLSGHVRGIARVGYDFASAIVNRYDHSLQMGGIAFSVGVEAQL